MKGRGHLRIIAGAARSRRLGVPRGRDVRPTPDRVREALFSILGDRCAGASVVDVCAGTGALGLEALSRGATEVILIERDRRVATVLQENVSLVGLDGASVMVRDTLALLGELHRDQQAFDLFFVDPPFHKNLIEPILRAITEGDLLALNGLVVVEHPANSMLTFQGLKLVDERHYGNVALTFLESE